MAMPQVMKALGPKGGQQFNELQGKLPLSLAMELLVMWQASDPRRFKSLCLQGVIIPLLEQQASLLEVVTDKEADQQATGHLAQHEIMQMCRLPITLRKALGTSPAVVEETKDGRMERLPQLNPEEAAEHKAGAERLGMELCGSIKRDALAEAESKKYPRGPSTLFLNKDGKIEDKRNGLLYGSAEWRDWVDDFVASNSREERDRVRNQFQATPEEEKELEQFRQANQARRAATT